MQKTIKNNDVSQSLENIRINTAGIKVHNFPVGIFVDQDRNIVYTVNQYSNTLSIIELEQGKTDTIYLDHSPYDIDKNLLTNMIYITHPNSNSISVVDGSTNRLISSIDNIFTPVNIKIDSLNGYFYVTNIDKNTITRFSIINPQNNKTVHVGDKPYDIGINQKNNKIYVTNLDNNTVTIINRTTFSILDTISVGNSPVGLAIDEVSNNTYISNLKSNNIYVLDGESNEILDKIPTGNKPTGITVNDQGIIYVSNIGDETVSVINNSNNHFKNINNIDVNPNVDNKKHSRLPPSINFPNVASFIDINENTAEVYVTNTASNIISVINNKYPELLVGITFDIQPPNSGYIECKIIGTETKLNFSSTKYIRYPLNTELLCTPYSPIGYDFNYWGSDYLGHQIDSMDIIDELSSWFIGFFSYKQDTPITFKLEKSDTVLSAHFKEGSKITDYINLVLIPLVFLAGIPFFRWIYKKYESFLQRKNNLRKRRKLMDYAYKSISNDIDEALEYLRAVRYSIIRDYNKGEISESDYNELMIEISNNIIKLKNSNNSKNNLNQKI
ncbi:MAG: YncE family protein [Nitrososphaeraceae archaeon]